ncbi:MAG: ABC transporter permease [Hydrogenophaga sp.]|nr:ABC transporter permease [Hydrogenophaga sp.]
MAQALRFALIRRSSPAGPPGRRQGGWPVWLATLPVLLILGPLLPGLVWALAPAFDTAVWQALWADTQWPRALRTTLWSAGLGTLLGMALAFGLATLLYPGPRWLALQRRLPLLLSVPHAAFAVGLFFLLSPSGWLARAVAPFTGWVDPPAWTTVQDPFGLSLALALGLKESWFLLWVLMAVLGEQTVQRHMVVARSLGYSRVQAWRHVLWPQLLPRLGWPLAAVLAYSLSVVDMAVVLGPSTPPTLAVLVWQWLTDPDAAVQAKGAAASIVLLVLFLLIAGAARLGWRLMVRRTAYPAGVRRPEGDPSRAGLHRLVWLVGYAVVAVLLLWSLAGTWFFPSLWPDTLSLQTWMQADWAPFRTTLWLAAAATLLCLPATLLWLEWGPQRFNALLYVPLIIPALPLVAAQYAALLRVQGDGTAAGLVWSHLLWVLPYMVLTLIGPYRAFDRRLMTTARALGQSPLSACLRVKWPMLVKPILAALAVGFAVSVAQYLPTLFAGGGRFVTVTTEAVALSAGGNRRVLAVQALLQIVLPLLVFGLAAALSFWAGRRRQGLR